jgi:RNA polymerase sigma-B factor
VDPLTQIPLSTTEIARRRPVCPDDALREEQIVRDHQPMARRMAGRFAGHGADFDDLVQVASLALVKAYRRFDPERGAFEPYAKATIDGELKRHLRDHCWSIRPPRRVQELQSEISHTTEALAQGEACLPRAAELAEVIGASVTDINEALSARSCFTPASLDRPLDVAGPTTMADHLAADDDPFAHVDNMVALGQICTELSEADKTLIRLRFYEGMSQREIAAEIGVSQMQVSRRLARLLDELRTKALEGEVA